MNQTHMKTTAHSGKAGIGAILAVVAVAIVALAAVVVVRGMAGGGQPLPLLAITSEPKAFSGNTYQVEARIDTLLGYEDGVGRLLLTREIDSDLPAPLFIPAKLVDFSPNPGQVYRFQVRVDGDGVIMVDSYKKL